MLEYSIFTKYFSILGSLQNLEPEWRTILQSVRSYFEKFPDHHLISLDELETWFWHQNPGLKDRESYDQIFIRMRELQIGNPDLLSDLLNTVVEKHILARVSGISIEVINGERPTGIEEVGALIEEYKKLTDAAKDADNDVCDLSIADLFAPEADGFQWRLHFLNEKLGPLKVASLGHIYARPDAGKTSLALSEATFLARQMTDRPILYLNNEEDIRRVKRWAVCSMLGVKEVWIQQNPVKAEVLWKHNGGDKIKFIGEVHDIASIEKYIQVYNPRIVFIDQGPKVMIPGSNKLQGPDILKKLYNSYRSFGKNYDTSIITLGQADDASTNRQWLGLTNIDSSKVGIPGELDWALGIGFIDDPKFLSVRYLNIAKNKFTGRRGRREVTFKMEYSRFHDVSEDRS